MRLDQLVLFFQTSPAVKLLRSPQGAFIADFLHQQFKQSARITLPLSELLEALREYLEAIHEPYPDVLRDKPEQYLAAWCAGDNRWLHRFLEAGRNEPVYQLTPHTEDVFLFLDRALEKDLGFVGTESRLRLVIDTLADLVAGASDDPEVHLRHLHDERARIDAEIARVERDGVAARYEPAAIRERFSTAVTMLKQLMGDFRAVEERFKEITQQVQQRQSHGQETRGNILAFALDSEDLLKKEDQGVSFYEFVRFILSPSQQDRLQAIISELARLDELAQQSEGLAAVRRMVPSLLAEAEKVMRTNQRLSATLRRLLDVHSASDRQRLAQLLREIQGLAAGLASKAPPEGVGIAVDVGIPLALPQSRTFWSPPAEFDAIDLVEHPVDDGRRMRAFQLLGQMQRLDWQSMRDHITHVAQRLGTVSLTEIVEEFPLRVGVVELLGYLQIAKDDGHLISRESVEEIVIPLHGGLRRALRVTVPTVYFVASPRSLHV